MLPGTPEMHGAGMYLASGFYGDELEEAIEG